MVRQILQGFQKAAVVFYTTEPVRRQIVHHGLIDPHRLIHAPNGVASEFTADPHPDNVQATPRSSSRPFLLHVGSCIARKRIDVLLDVFAAARNGRDLRLIQIGGEWTADQTAQIAKLGIAGTIEQKRGLTRTQLATLYRKAAIVLQPSEAEGFGLPVIEALACGAAVIASDIPPLREVGGDAVDYCPVGDVAAWSETIGRLLDDPSKLPDRSQRLSRSALFSWATQARTIADAYVRLLETGSPTRP
jgi:glycosyltransferase involved in cell wall biosynthesis